MTELGRHYSLKPGSVRPPKEYLGLDIRQLPIQPANSGLEEICLTMASDTYVERAITDVCKTLDEFGQLL